MACACIRLLENLEEARRLSVTRHALRFGNVHYSEIKRIVEHELDRQQESAPAVTNCWSEQMPTFARSGTEYQERTDISWDTSVRTNEEATDATA